jgi:uncharacterized protein (TIGR02391 family)
VNTGFGSPVSIMDARYEVNLARLNALRQNLPALIDEDIVRDYNAIVRALQAVSRDENMVHFLIPQGELKPRITSVVRGTARRPGRANYSRDNYCDGDLFERQITAFWSYIQKVDLERQSKPTGQANGKNSSEWHHEIEKVSRELFRGGHYREAVLNSYIRVIEAVRLKSGIQEDGDSLMGHAFGCEVGRPPKVQFNPCQTQADIDEQKGIMFLFKGVVGMRNFKAHTVRLLDDELRAGEYLGLSSLLMRLLDLATVNS